MSKSPKELRVKFHKYHGAGNDFIIIDNRKMMLEFDVPRVKFLCHRHFGIGADGLICIEHAAEADFRMIYYNADGNEGSMCGNGGRTAAAFAFETGIVGNYCRFIAFDGLHEAWVEKKQERHFWVKLSMADVEGYMPFNNDLIINTGSPHYIQSVAEVETVDVHNAGRTIRNNKHIAHDGVNVNFVQANGHMLKLRTYERGVEAETLSCGTGATAAAIANCIWSGHETSEIHTKGGILKVSVKKNHNRFTDIFLSGPVQMVFSGSIVISEL
jgi:diaminopimelate epimerase